MRHNDFLLRVLLFFKKNAIHLFKHIFEELNRFYPFIKPQVINLNVNDICNSKCVMCNIWKNKKEYEFDASELSNILKDTLYSKVRHVGITGGEPTLRKDLADLYMAVIDTLPNLKGVSIITNAIQVNQVKQRLKEIHKVCNDRQIPFDVMVSLDGIGEIHDKVRGRKGNFENALKIIAFAQNELGLPTSIGCTITKSSVWHVDDLLDFLIEKGIYGHFRIAEFISRLYNEDNQWEIRNFNEEESYHLQCFFQKLIYGYEESPDVRRTYKSIINQLSGGKRLIGCQYKSEGIVLGSNGDLRYCAPKSPVIGNSLIRSSSKIFRRNNKIRNHIINNDCENCIHDYHSSITLNEQINIYLDYFWDRLLQIQNINKFWLLIPGLFFSKLNSLKTKEVKRIFIVGWYGTETTGDKAILGGVIKHYKEIFPEAKFSVSSLYPFVTKRTLNELGINADVIKAKSYRFINAAASSDFVVMGGGPLMDLEELSIPLWAFTIAKTFNRRTVLHGVGIGPVRKVKYKKAVNHIIKLSDELLIRDTKSLEWILTNSNRKNGQLIPDPAIPFIKNISINKNDERRIVTCFLREWTFEYSGVIDFKQFQKSKEEFELKLGGILKKIAILTETKLLFYPMHTFVVGGDDRDFCRKFTRRHLEGIDFEIFNRLTTVKSTLKVMKNALLNICMRYHSTVFAHTINAKFFSIDYTNGGKVSSFMNDINSNNFLTLTKIINSPVDEVVDKILRQIKVEKTY